MDHWIENHELTSYRGEEKNVTVPEGVTKIGPGAFHKFYSFPPGTCHTIESVVIPAGVTFIGEGAFAGCLSLTEVTILGDDTELAASVFMDCIALRNVRLPRNLRVIRKDLFRDCLSLTRLDLPAGVERIEKGAFDGCVNLKQIRIPEGISEIPGRCFFCCRSLEKVSIPDHVTCIGKNAFEGCESLQTLYIPDSVSEIREKAFASSGLRRIRMSETLTGIGRALFLNCEALETVRLPRGITKIPFSMFEGCVALRSAAIPEGVSEICCSAFEGCRSLRDIRIPDTLTDIDIDAFKGCVSLEEIELPETLERIHTRAFEDTVTVTRRPVTGESSLSEPSGDREADAELSARPSISDGEPAVRCSCDGSRGGTEAESKRAGDRSEGIGQTRILFIDDTNTRRSPIAESIMKDIAACAGLEKQIRIASAGTRAKVDQLMGGEKIDPAALKKLKRHNTGVFTDRTWNLSQKATPKDYGLFDLLIAMDQKTLHEMEQICGGDPEGKISLLLDHCGRRGQDVPDPGYTDDFDVTFIDLLQGCAGLMEELRGKI